MACAHASSGVVSTPVFAPDVMNLALIHAFSPTPINGLVALEAGFLVCLKQLVVG